MRKLFKGLVAALALTTLVGSALADEIKPTTTIKNTAVEMGDTVAANFDAAGLDPKTAKSITVTFTCTDMSVGFTGSFILSTKANNWKGVEFGNEGSDKPIIAEATENENEFTMTREVPDDFFAKHVPNTSGEYAQIVIAQYWGATPINVTEIAVELNDGSKFLFSKDVKSSDDTNTASDDKKDDTTKTDDKKDTTTTTTTTKTDDKKDEKKDPNAKTGDATSVAALAFVALVAMGGAVVVSKKRV